jgi:hypothetical protein
MPPKAVEALRTYLEAEGPRRSPASPFIARTRAVQGLCALALGDVRTAAGLAAQSRHALQAQATVSPWFRQPLARLEGALGRVAPTARAQT